MKTTNKNTGYVLLKASTSSEWDFCDFAIIRITEEWKFEQMKRLVTITGLKGDPDLLSMNYYDTSATFYQIGETPLLIDDILCENEWTFVILEKDEEENFCLPESKLDYYTLVIRPDSTAFYKAYGKYTDEEFRTKSFPIMQLLINDNTSP
ncbi:hypothetical protein [Flavobacterium cerinum]|uniref:IPExxxVDY family protein n=1 Tax=Flavobacterium cerinum TaxID=2502784 RepID=A0ABY5IMT5_9FLAO|nr:hypothetical protein [Flavobacterium cerinum]UUC44153.1 hypothetical protein NOX80_10965 [Flavobacterium cerinum]